MGSETVHTSADTSAADSWTPERLQAEVDSRTWFHTIDLGNGVRTPGQKDTPTEVGIMQLPDMTGRSVLDIGAYDGFYSFESERRGAARVVAADSWSWNWPGSDARRNFDLAHEVLSSSVETKTVLVEDVSARDRRRDIRRRVVPRGAVPRARPDRVPEGGAQRHQRPRRRRDGRRPARRRRAGRGVLPVRLVERRRQQLLRAQPRRRSRACCSTPASPGSPGSTRGPPTPGTRSTRRATSPRASSTRCGAGSSSGFGRARSGRMVFHAHV